MTGPTYLLVTAEDYGLSAGVNRGILEACDYGIVRNVSVLANFVRPEDLRPLRRRKEVGVGLHFCLTVGRPVAPPEEVPSLVQADGQFHPAWIKVEETVQAEDIRKELEAQYAVLRAAGLRVCYLDSHHHVHILPKVLNVVLPFARRHRLAVRGSTPHVRAQLIEARIPTPNWYSMDFLNEPNITVQGFQRLLDELPGGFCEISTHPGYPDPELLDLTDYVFQRSIELATLTNQRVMEALEKRNIVLTNYCTLKKIYRTQRRGAHAGSHPLG